MSVVRFAGVMQVWCRHCGATIEVDLPDGLTPEAAFAECETQAEEKHTCAAKQAAESKGQAR